MTSFISRVLRDIVAQHEDTSKLILIFPSKRAGNYFKKELAKQNQRTQFAPSILSIEEFVKNLSGLQLASSLDLLFKFYDAYLAITDEKDTESFKSVSSWAQQLIGDISEIDRFLVEPKQLFSYLGAIKELNSWSVDGRQTEGVKNYLSFWEKLPQYYSSFNNILIETHKGHQGLLYREAVNQLEGYLGSNKNHHVFVGFNALNKAEEIIIKECLQQDRASIYWDIDDHFVQNPNHDAGHFIRQHKSTWTYYKNHKLNWIETNYSEPKSIEVAGCSKQIGQIKYVGQILTKQLEEKGSLDNTAIVLGDENLLLPLLNTLPQEVGKFNVTMGIPLKNSAIAFLFDTLMSMHKSPTEKFYFKEVLQILEHPLVQLLKGTELITSQIKTQNLVYISLEDLNSADEQLHTFLTLALSNWKNSPQVALTNSLNLISLLKQVLSYDKAKHDVELEFLYRFYNIFNELENIISEYSHINDIDTLRTIYKELINTETLDFEGNPYEGLQIMGMLESRVLDFETVIITSVNEGILPAGKSNNSFIPFEAKITNGLPTYKEKDAIYTYHFYHLLQRAKTIFITYNTEPDILNGGEISRFIRQLEFEGVHNIQHKIISLKVKQTETSLKTIEKTPDLLEDLKHVAGKGFSPSSLTNYIRNPIDFYYEKCLGVRVFEDVEETVASNTLGNIIHKTLEELYLPFLGKSLQKASLTVALKKVDVVTTKNFKEEFKKGDFTKGKNLIIFEVAKRYIENFISIELKELEAGNVIEIVALERQLKTQLEIPKLGFPIVLKGIVDRVDRCNGILRIIDYKTGKVEQNKVEIVNWEDLNMDYEKYSKSFQILTYAYMYSRNVSHFEPMEAGIISFKNLKNGFLKFGQKESTHSRKKNHLISKEVLDSFEIQLKTLILEIFNREFPFIEKAL